MTDKDKIVLRKPLAPAGGKVKFTVAPKGGGAMGTSRPTSFFFRVRMK